MNLSDIDPGSLAGKALRLPLRLVPGEKVLKIRRGRLRGKQWIAGSHIHGCWLGTYEHEKQSRITEAVPPGAVFFDVGAHVGFYTLLASVLVGPEGKVFAFEPFPRNVAYLEKHVALNALENVTLIPAAVADAAGEARFQAGEASSMGRISEEGTIAVRQVSLDDLYSSGSVPLPNYMKIDVEGAEARVLRGAQRLLTMGRPTLFLATHGLDIHHECLSLLDSLDYLCSPLTPGQDLASCDEIIATAKKQA